MRVFKVALGVICLHFLVMQQAASAADLAGTASIVAGSVSAVGTNGGARLLSKGDAVYSGEHIVTGSAGYARLGLLDGGSIVLRPKTEFAIESFRFKPGLVESAVQLVPPKAAPVPTATAAVPVPTLQIADQSDEVGSQAFFRLVRGGFRAVSGLVGKLNREEYAVRTPVATIGIRGTVYASVFCDAICAADAVVQGGVPTGESALGGLVSTVEQGSIQVVSIAGKAVVISPGQFVLTTLSGTNVLLPGPPGFLAGEDWLNAAQNAASAEPGAATTAATAGGSTAAAGAGAAAQGSTLLGTALSTAPTLGSIAAAVAITAAVLTTDTSDSGKNNGPTSTAP